MTGYTRTMKTAISVPDGDFDRFERVAAAHGMNRSQFFQLAGRRLADELEGASELTSLADAVLSRAGQPSGDRVHLTASERIVAEGSEW